MNSTELKTILDLHEKWLIKEPDGKRANLYMADLRGADLSGAYLSGAKLSGADLRGADLSGADLSGTNLRGTNLIGADLSGCNLGCADLSGSNLCRANLSCAYLYMANLSRTILSYSDLSNADLCCADLSASDINGADLSGCNLGCADLSGADLSGADLSGAKNINCPISCPEKGSFIGFKKANGLIVELEIPSDALRSSATTRKCRCSKAKVISITNPDGSPSNVTSIPSSWDSNFIYTIGDMVEVKDFDANRWNECAPGIHFFITRQEAVNY